MIIGNWPNGFFTLTSTIIITVSRVGTPINPPAAGNRWPLPATKSPLNFTVSNSIFYLEEEQWQFATHPQPSYLPSPTLRLTPVHRSQLTTMGRGGGLFSGNKSHSVYTFNFSYYVCAIIICTYLLQHPFLVLYTGRGLMMPVTVFSYQKFIYLRLISREDFLLHEIGISCVWMSRVEFSLALLRHFNIHSVRLGCW